MDHLEKLENLLIRFGKLFFIFHPASWTWLSFHARHYAAAVVLVLIINILLLLLGIFVPWAAVPAIAFILSIVIIVLTYIPIGLVNTAINATNLQQAAYSLKYHLYPLGLRRLLGWLAVLGWLGVVYNPWLNFWTVTVGIFLFFIFEAFGSKKTASNKKTGNPLVIAVVVCLTIWVAWSYASPDSHGAFARYYSSWVGIAKTQQHRSSIVNEAEALVTYAKVNRDVTVLYRNLEDDQLQVESVAKKLAKDSIVKVVGHKNFVLDYDGQGFVQIQLPNRYGTFVGGDKYWIEADYLEPISPSDWRAMLNKPEPRPDAPVVSLPDPPKVESGIQKTSGYFSSPGHYFMAGPGAETGWIEVGPCLSYFFTSGAKITLFYQDGSYANSWEVKKWPDKERFKLKNQGDKAVSLIITGRS